MVWGCTWSRGGCTWSLGGVPGPRGCTRSRGMYLVPGGGVYLGGVPGSRGVYLLGGGPGRGAPAQVLPPVNRMTDRQV